MPGNKKSIEAKTFMGTEPMWSLLKRLSLPATIGMMVNALYNLVDTIFVGQGVGAYAIGALSIAFPIQMLVSAFAQMFGMGSASIISRRLGEKREDAAAAAAGTALSATFLFALIITVLGNIFINPLLVIFGATDDILPYAREYLSIIFYGAVFLSITMASNNIIRAEGKAKTAMVIMIIGTGANLLLDPLFIFGFGMGIRGAAVATVISQMMAFLFAVRFFSRKQSALPLHLKSFRIQFRELREMIILGFSVFVRQAGGSLMALSVNNMLALYGGSMAITAYGMVLRVMMFFFMPIFGIVQGFQPIAGFNYGARNMARVKEVVWKSILATTAMATFAFMLVMLFPRSILSIFTSDEGALSLAVPAIRTILLMIPLLGVQAIGSTFFQSIGRAVPALFLGLSRQFIFLIPLVLLLPQFFGLPGVWYAFPIADFLATLVTAVWMLLELKRICRAADGSSGTVNRC